MESLPLKKPSELTPPINATLITDIDGLNKLLDFFARVTVFGLDIETTVTDDVFTRRIRTIQVGDKQEQYVIDLLAFIPAGQKLADHQGSYAPSAYLQPVLETLRPVLESRQWLKVGHNLNFEYENLKWCLGLRPWNFYDTMWAEKVLFAGKIPFNISGVWALDDLALKYCRVEMEKSLQKSFDLETPLTQAQVDYAALDTRIPLAIKQAQQPQLTKTNLNRAAQIEFDVIPAFGDLHLNGLLVDEALWATLVLEVRELHKANVAKLDPFFLPVVGPKDIPVADLVWLEQRWRKEVDDKSMRAAYREEFVQTRKRIKEATEKHDTYEGQAAINYGASGQLHKALLKMGYTKQKLPNTNDQVLKVLEGEPVIDAIRDYRTTSKILDTYANLPQDNKNPITGRIHSRFNQLGAETGRSSSSGPNVQNILRGSDWRSCFIARPGYKMLTIDYNGCELRIMAEYSRERVWLDAFKAGWDVHSVGAEMLYGDRWKNAAESNCAYYATHQKCKCKEHKVLRNYIKAVNFGLAYGMEAKKLSEELGISITEAKHLLAEFRRAFPTLIAWLESQGKKAKAILESRTLAQRRRLFSAPDWQHCRTIAIAKLIKRGKTAADLTDHDVNRVHKAQWGAVEREGKNGPVQGSNADIIKLAMGCGFDPDGKPYLWHILEPVYGAQLENMVHDELLIEKKDDDQLEPCFQAAIDGMQRAGAEFVKSIPMIAEGHIDSKWVKD